MIGFIRPFKVVQTYVYLAIYDSQDKLFCFMSIDEADRKNARRLVDHMNKVSKYDEIYKSRNNRKKRGQEARRGKDSEARLDT